MWWDHLLNSDQVNFSLFNKVEKNSLFFTSNIKSINEWPVAYDLHYKAQLHG
jgi:hypothetical protein